MVTDLTLFCLAEHVNMLSEFYPKIGSLRRIVMQAMTLYESESSAAAQKLIPEIQKQIRELEPALEEVDISIYANHLSVVFIRGALSWT